jgi:hypothetical protein
MGGGSKKQTVGYRYYLGMHMVLCHGPVDTIREILIGDKSAWEGVAEDRVTIDKPSLFGGDDGEGGVVGDVDILWGGPTQAQNDYLIAKVGGSQTAAVVPTDSLIGQMLIAAGALDPAGTWTTDADAVGVPAFRGVTSVVLRRPYLGNNPYIKPWSFKVQRILKTSDGGEQWYAARAPIRQNISSIGLAYNTSYEYQILPGEVSAVADPASFAIPTTGWNAESPGPFGNTLTPPHARAPYPIATHWPHNSALWLRKTITLEESFNLLELYIVVENACYVYWDGVYVGSINPTNAQITDYPDSTISVPAGMGAAGEHTIHVYCLDESANYGPTGDWTFFYIELGGYSGYSDMNPAHIIRECLVDRRWGLGYLSTDVDDTSFTAAADQLWDEGFGLSMLWDKSISLEEFIGEVVRHIDATLYIDRTTGKFVLKLIRDDYIEDDLITLGDDDIISVEDYRRPSIDELTNSVTVVYEDWETAENATVADQDIALIQAQGGVIGQKLEYPGISNLSLAKRVASRDLASLSNPPLSCTIYATRKAASLNIGAVFKFGWTDLHAGYILMRITGMSFGDGRSNQVKLSCIQDIFSLTDASDLYSTPIETFTDTNQAPANTTNRILVEAPYYEAVQQNGQSTVDGELALEPDGGVFMATSGKPAYALNAALYVDSGAGYEESATVVDFCPTALLSADIGKTDTTIAIKSGLDLSNITVGSHAQIGDELVRIDTVTTTELTVGRGVLDTVPQNHLTDAVVFFWDYFGTGDGVGYVASEAINVKLLAKNDTGEIAIADAVAQPLTFASRAIRPFPPGNLKFNAAYFPDSLIGDIVLTWAHRDRLQQTSGTFYDFTDTNIGPESGTTYTIRIYSDADVLLRTVTGEIGTAWTYTAAMETTDGGPYNLLRFEVEAVRGGYTSWQTHNHSVGRAGYGLAYGNAYGGLA